MADVVAAGKSLATTIKIVKWDKLKDDFETNRITKNDYRQEFNKLHNPRENTTPVWHIKKWIELKEAANASELAASRSREDQRLQHEISLLSPLDPNARAPMSQDGDEDLSESFYRGQPDEELPDQSPQIEAFERLNTYLKHCANDDDDIRRNQAFSDIFNELMKYNKTPRLDERIGGYKLFSGQQIKSLTDRLEKIKINCDIYYSQSSEIRNFITNASIFEYDLFACDALQCKGRKDDPGNGAASECANVTRKCKNNITKRTLDKFGTGNSEVCYLCGLPMYGSGTIDRPTDECEHVLFYNILKSIELLAKTLPNGTSPEEKEIWKSKCKYFLGFYKWSHSSCNRLKKQTSFFLLPTAENPHFYLDYENIKAFLKILFTCAYGQSFLKKKLKYPLNDANNWVEKVLIPFKYSDTNLATLTPSIFLQVILKNFKQNHLPRFIETLRQTARTLNDFLDEDTTRKRWENALLSLNTLRNDPTTNKVTSSLHERHDLPFERSSSYENYNEADPGFDVSQAQVYTDLNTIITSILSPVSSFGKKKKEKRV